MKIAVTSAVERLPGGSVDLAAFHDVGGRNNLRRWLDLPDQLDYDGVRGALAPWRRYGGLIYFHQMLDRLAEAGYLPSIALQPATRKAQRRQ